MSASVFLTTPANQVWTPTATFSSIPPELRTRIYEYILADPKGRETIRITIIRHKTRRAELYQQKQITGRTGKDVGEWDRHRRVHKAVVPPRTAILSADKATYAEAISVLYGNDTFAFYSIRELRDILPMIGEGAKHLRRIAISGPGSLTGRGYHKTMAKQVFTSLGALPNLQNIKLGHLHFCQKAGQNTLQIDQVIKDALPMLKALRLAYERSGRNWNVLDVLEIGLIEDCHYCRNGDTESSRTIKQTMDEHYYHTTFYDHCSCLCSEVTEKIAPLQARLRSDVAKALGIKEPEIQKND